MHSLRVEKNVSASSTSSAAAFTCTAIEKPALWMRTALHDLAQPLTTLECVLFLTTLEPELDEAQLRQAIDEALKQCRRMTAGVRAMQDRLQDGR